MCCKFPWNYELPVQPSTGSEGGDGGAFPGVGSVPPKQPGRWNHPHKKKDMEIWYFPENSMGRTSWAKNVSFREGIYHPYWELVALATQLDGSGSGTWGAGDVAIPKVSRDASPTETTGNTEMITKRCSGISNV